MCFASVFLKKRRKQLLFIFEVGHHLKILTNSGLIHLPDFFCMCSYISILKILEI